MDEPSSDVCTTPTDLGDLVNDDLCQPGNTHTHAFETEDLCKDAGVGGAVARTTAEAEGSASSSQRTASGEQKKKASVYQAL